MLPYFKSWYVEKILKKKKRLSNIENDIMDLIDKLRYYSGKYENYDYDYGILVKALSELRKERHTPYKNTHEYNNLNLKMKGVEGNRDRAFDECIKLDEMILNKADELNIEIDDEMVLDYKRASGKSAFRTGESQGRGMVRNMNKITGTALKRFK